MEYKTYKNIKIPQNLSPEKQALVDEIARNYIKKDKQIQTDHMSNMARMGLGTLVSGASFLPVLNIPYVGTGLGGAMYDAGQAIVEGDSAADIAKRAGRGFAIGETVGAVPYVGKAASKTKAGQAVGKQFDKVAEKVAANPAVQKAYDALIQDVKYTSNLKPGYILLGNNGKPLTVYHGTDEVFEDFIPKGNSDFADAVYFSDNKNVAKTYTHTNNIKERYLDLDNPLEVDANGRTYNEYYDQLRSDFNQALNNNNDGIIVKNIIDDNLQKEGLGELSNEYIVFNPSKIKKREELYKKKR